MKMLGYSGKLNKLGFFSDNKEIITCIIIIMMCVPESRIGHCKSLERKPEIV